MITNIDKKYKNATITKYGSRNFENSQAMLFHENSKLSEYSSIEFSKSVLAFDQQHITERASNPYKIYPNAKIIPFSKYSAKNSFPEVDLFTSLRRRHSTRKFQSYDIKIKELYQILHFSYGIQRSVKLNAKNVTWSFRSVPSAGGLYPLEIYCVIFNGELDKGLYHFRPDQNGLEFIKQGDFCMDLQSKVKGNKEDLSNSSCMILITGLYERLAIKYKDRGYRFMITEVGAVLQNISLISEALDLGSCTWGGYLDDDINKFIGISSIEETVLCAISIGKPK